MNHIGNVIKEVRSNLGMSRNELSENICSEKYLYLIERGDRTPSTEIVRLFSIKLGTDLFDYYQFLDCIDPIKVCESINQFETYQRDADFVSLKKFSDTISELPDFKRKPWVYEIAANKITHMLFVEHKCNETITYTEEILSKIEPKYSEKEFVVKLYVILSTCYQIMNDVAKAKQIISIANQIVTNKRNIRSYNQHIISLKLNTMTLCHLCGEYDAAIEEGLWINRFQLESNTNALSNFVFYYLAFSYYKKGMIDEAFEWFEKCLYELLVHYSPIPAQYISNYPLFYELFNDKRTSPDLISKIKNKYGFIQ
ncbi:hypothetical protein DSECCO2_256280 [anaerobic digester metagenome]